MGKTTQKELLLQADLIGTKFDKKGKRVDTGLIGQGWFATKTTDRFKAGRPDLRIARADFGQMDVELKYVVDDYNKAPPEGIPAGLTKLQWLKLKEMNEHGMPAICLVYMEAHKQFFVTTVLRDIFPAANRCVTELPGGKVIDGAELFKTAMEHLYDLGYKYPGYR